MNAQDFDFDSIRPLDLNKETLAPGSMATPFSTLLWAVAGKDLATAEAQITDDIEWGLMPYNQYLKGKAQVMSWLKTATSDQKRPVVITNAATDTWGVLEYWNIGVVSKEVIQFGNEQNWPWPRDPSSFLGKNYKVSQCFTYHINAEGKIDFMRQYMDTGSIWAQL